MDRKLVFQSAFFAALVALISVLVMGYGVPRPESVPTWQPSDPSVSPSEFLRPGNAYPRLALGFFAADSLFVLSYTMVFVGLHATAAGRSRSFAGVGLGAGLLAALLDAGENAFYITYATAALNGTPATEPALPLIYILTDLKWMVAFAAFYAFGLAWPREGALGWTISALMLLYPLFGVLGVAWPVLVPWRGLFFLVGLPLFAAHFWREARSA